MSPSSKKLGRDTTALYHRARQGCRTSNQKNKLRIQLENRMSPLELASFVVEKLEAEDQAWVNSIRQLCMQSGKTRPEPFLRKRLHPGVMFYGSETSPAEKTLLVCFSGHAHRLMMPTPVFLQYLDATKVDLILLKDASRSGYKNGLRGLGVNLESMIDGLKILVPVGEYQRTVSLGVSIGGLPAVVSALRMSMDACLSVSGMSPLDSRLSEQGIDGKDLLLRNVKGASKRPDLYYAYGSGSEEDKAAGEALEKIIPTELICIFDDKQKVGHSVLAPMAERGKLADFLDFTIFRAVPD